jgi:ABC-type branched-subunit amino acid transport system ATPase component/MFS family permease
MSPASALRRLVDGGPVYPLAILFGLNAVDELDRAAFGILLPEIREAFGLDLTGVLTLVAITGVVGLLLQVPIGLLVDRSRRVPVVLVGATVWGLASMATGLAPTVIALGIFRTSSGLGKAIIDPTHNSLIADYYPPEVRVRAYSFHKSANAVGAFVGPLLAGLLAYATNWRVPFILFGIPTLLLVLLGLKLREPVRGAHERRAMGVADDVVDTEEIPPSFAESWRMVWRIEALRRIWYALPFLTVATVGYGTLAGLLYEERFGLDERARGVIAALVEPAQLVGLVIGAVYGTRMMAKNPGLALKLVSVTAMVSAGLAALWALAPSLPLSIAAQVLLAGSGAVLAPSITASLTMAIPPSARGMGLAVGSLWVLPGLLVLPLIGAIGDRWGLERGMLVMTPVLAIGGLVIATSGSVIERDIRQVWQSAAARAEVLLARRAGRAKLLIVRDLDVWYDSVQVLFGVNIEIDEGEIVALLGTNGAGKSTLLKAIAGVVGAQRGAVVFDGREMTFAPPDEVAARGMVLMPGGAGVFPSLTVDDNLRVASYLLHDDEVEAAQRHVFELFPELESRRSVPAVNMSGGQQQMLALSMVMLTRPRLLVIDELSLGLAPVVVDRLLDAVREINAAGTTVILVDQSVDLALSVAETAYFMEKGEIRFSGLTADLLQRPDLLRSVFLAGAGEGADATSGRPAAEPTELTAVSSRMPSAPIGTAPASSGPAETPALQTVGLGCNFGGVAAVSDVDLSVGRGEIVCIVGPNGAGKTTLFDLVSGFTTANAGVVRLDGREVSGMKPHLRARNGLGRSFQDARLYPSLTVEETISVSLEQSLRSSPGARSLVAAVLMLPGVQDAEQRLRERVDELIELFGLEAFRHKFVRELSTGSRRVVDLACIVAHRPSVILLDEPSSGIAQRETQALVDVLRRVRERTGASLVIIEHDMPLVRSVADRLVAMDQGRVIADGDPETVLADAAVVTAYLGAGRAAHRSERPEAVGVPLAGTTGTEGEHR